MSNWKKYDPIEKYSSKILYDVKVETGRIISGCTFKAGVFTTPDGGTVRNDHPFEIRKSAEQ